jgi:hypothetical protein
MEIDSQFFWSGAPWDMVSRAYVADTLNRGLHRSSFDQTNVIAVSAMEAIGLSSKCMHATGTSLHRPAVGIS